MQSTSNISIIISCYIQKGGGHEYIFLIVSFWGSRGLV